MAPKLWWPSLLRCPHFVLSVRFLLPWGRSQSGVSANSLSLTSNETKFSLIGSCPRVYHYIIREDGQPMYLGHRNSVLYYNASLPSWVWYDRKDNRSVAISISPESSLFLGLTTFFLANVDWWQNINHDVSYERCSQCGLFRGARWQVPHWSWRVSGEDNNCHIVKLSS